MQLETKNNRRGTGDATVAAMSTPLSYVAPTPANSPRSSTSFVSLVAGKLGREAVWVLIASIFLFVEALVFLTQLPTTKIFHRREAPKHAPHAN